MRKIIFIFVLLIGCCEINEEPKTKVCMISNSLPVQLWLADQPTFNEKNEAGIEKRCFFAPILCSQKIKLVLPISEGSLVVEDSNGNELLDTPLVSIGEEGEINTFNTAAITAADGFGVGNVWDGNVVELIIPAPMANDNSNLKFFEFEKPAQTFTVNVSWILELISGFVSSTTIHFSLRKSDIAEEIEEHSFSIAGASGTQEFTIEADEQVYYIGVYISALSGEAGTVEAGITEITIQDADVPSGFSSIEFIPENISACGKKIRIKILDGDDELYAKSDLLQVKESFIGGRLIKYSNAEEFDGIPYHLETMDFEFLVLSRFFKERQPEENESSDTEGGVDILLSTIKDQKKFEVEPAPPYFHKKTKRVIKHNSVFIDNQQWVSEEEYEVEEMDDKSPFDKGSTWLTLKDGSYVTNPFA